jgi:hypothetical protein
MRVGFNPEKENNTIKFDIYHRIIIPVYIPNFEGYFKDGLEIFKLCIQSLLMTVHEKTRITIYNNASHVVVENYINELYKKEELIDQVFHSKINVGKINAILAASKGCLEPLITVSDADVFFKNNWQSSVEKIFMNFREAGMVSPVPSSKAFKNFVDANWYNGFFKGKIRFENVRDKEGLIKFDESLGNSKPLYSPIHLKKYLVLTNKKEKAVMGCGHFVATLRREVFDKGSNSPAFKKIVGGVENRFIDQPNQDLGFLRLATLGNYAYHLGNTIDEWMFDEFKKITNNKEQPLDVEKLLTYTKYNFMQLKIGDLLKKILLSSVFKSWYFKKIGLISDKPLDY